MLPNHHEAPCFALNQPAYQNWFPSLYGSPMADAFRNRFDIIRASSKTWERVAGEQDLDVMITETGYYAEVTLAYAPKGQKRHPFYTAIIAYPDESLLAIQAVRARVNDDRFGEASASWLDAIAMLATDYRVIVLHDREMSRLQSEGSLNVDLVSAASFMYFVVGGLLGSYGLKSLEGGYETFTPPRFVPVDTDDDFEGMFDLDDAGEDRDPAAHDDQMSFLIESNDAGIDVVGLDIEDVFGRSFRVNFHMDGDIEILVAPDEPAIQMDPATLKRITRLAEAAASFWDEYSLLVYSSDRGLR